MSLQAILFLSGSALLIFGGWEGRGYYDNSKMADQLRAQIASQLAAVESARAAQAADDAIMVDIGKQTTVFREHETIKTTTLIRRIPEFVTPKAVAACIVTTGVIELLNNAATPSSGSSSTLSEPATGVIDTPSGIGIDTAASSIITNYGICNEALNRSNTAWPQWDARVKKVYEDWASSYQVWFSKQKR